MNANPRTQAILLLTTFLAGAEPDDPRPLTLSEWNRLAPWMHERGIGPEALFETDGLRALEAFRDDSVTLDRLRFLLGRSMALALAMDEWARTGIWVLTRSDAEYPRRLKKLLGNGSPPVLFGCGPKGLLNGSGVAVVGSRNASEEDLVFTSLLARSISNQGYNVVSGGARGVDEAAMLGALEMEGTAVGVLSDSLLSRAASRVYRPHILANNLVLISTVHPKARFDVGNAMGRNKYIYALSRLAVVISTDHGKGGTWSGAVENLKQGWVPLLVKRSETTGAEALVAQGARWIEDENLDIDAITSISTGAPVAQAEPPTPVMPEPDLFAGQPRYPVFPSELPPIVSEPERSEGEGAGAPEIEAATVQGPQPAVSAQEDVRGAFYGLFLQLLKTATATGPLSEAEIGERFGLEKAQVRAWLSRAGEEGRVEKRGKPVCYVWLGADVGPR